MSPQEIVRALVGANELVPDSLRQDAEEASFFVKSAEGVTTYSGFNGDKESENARKWLKARRARRAKELLR